MGGGALLFASLSVWMLFLVFQRRVSPALLGILFAAAFLALVVQVVRRTFLVLEVDGDDLAVSLFGRRRLYHRSGFAGFRYRRARGRYGTTLHTYWLVGTSDQSDLRLTLSSQIYEGRGIRALRDWVSALPDLGAGS